MSSLVNKVGKLAWIVCEIAQQSFKHIVVHSMAVDVDGVDLVVLVVVLEDIQ